MESFFVIFEIQYKEKVLSILNNFASKAALNCKNERQWNYKFENGNVFYFHCNECSVFNQETSKMRKQETKVVLKNSENEYVRHFYDLETQKILNSMKTVLTVSAELSDFVDSPEPLCLFDFDLTTELYFLIETFLSEIPGYAIDEFSDYLWKYDDIKNKKQIKGHLDFYHVYYDFNGWKLEYDLYGPYAKFGIMREVDQTIDYGVSFEMRDQVTYELVKIQDNAIFDWYPEIQKLAVYFHKLSRPKKGLARYGVTLIPPKSLDKFYDIVAKKTRSIYESKQQLLELISKAKNENKFIIHFGI